MKTNDLIEINNSDWFECYSELHANSIDLILTDIPWGILEKHEWDTQQDLALLERTFDYALKQNGLIVLFGNYQLFINLISYFSRFTIRTYHIWKKTSAMPISHIMPCPDAEFLAVFKRTNSKATDTTFNPYESGKIGNTYKKISNNLESPTRRHIKSKVSENDHGKRWIRTIIEAPNKPNMKRTERSSHPTQKPEAILRPIIKVYSNENDTILDPFAGSGSTLISAYKEKRVSIGFEIDRDFYFEANERINKISDQIELFE